MCLLYKHTSEGVKFYHDWRKKIIEKCNKNCFMLGTTINVSKNQILIAEIMSSNYY